MLEGRTIGFGITGSHCTIAEVLPEMERLVRSGARVIPFFSPSVGSIDTRFGTADHWRSAIEDITGVKPIETMAEAEPVGPKKLLDCMVIAPCTGNTLAKLALGITDTPVLMAAKAHLRNLRPVVIGISTNDALGINAKNLGLLMAMRNVYFVPLGQDDPDGKPNSMVARMTEIERTVLEALHGRQAQPLFVERWRDRKGT